VAKTASFEKFYKFYDTWFDDNRFVYLSELKAVRRFVPPGKKGVEVGSGSGKFSLPLGIRIGVEPSYRMQRLAVSRGMEIIDGVAECLPLRSELFDFVLMVTTICFLDDVESAFLEVRRVLKPGGSFIAGFVDRESAIGKMYQDRRHESKFYREAAFFSPSEVIGWMRRTGFSHAGVVQTVFGNSLDKITVVQDWKEGSGKGAFCVVRGMK